MRDKCAVCRRELTDSELKITMNFNTGNEVYICRDCYIKLNNSNPEIEYESVKEKIIQFLYSRDHPASYVDRYTKPEAQYASNLREGMNEYRYNPSFYNEVNLLLSIIDPVLQENYNLKRKIEELKPPTPQSETRPQSPEPY